LSKERIDQITSIQIICRIQSGTGKGGRTEAKVQEKTPLEFSLTLDVAKICAALFSLHHTWMNETALKFDIID
jgi:hypothetical protein